MYMEGTCTCSFMVQEKVLLKAAQIRMLHNIKWNTNYSVDCMQYCPFMHIHVHVTLFEVTTVTKHQLFSCRLWFSRSISFSSFNVISET